MKNIYLLSFTGGVGGDFLCSQISKDTNFYPLEFKIINGINRYDLENPFDKWDLDVKNVTGVIPKLIISDNTFEEIDLYYSEKNIITPTHFFGATNQIRLPRLKGIKLYTKQLSPFFYLLLWIKRWTSIRHFKNKEDFFNITGYSTFSKNVDAEIFKNKIADAIGNKKFFYSFELTASKYLNKNAINFVHSFFETYRVYSTVMNDNKGWIPYNIDNLYLDPNNNCTEFSQLFNTEQPISPEIITEYYSKNLRVIEETFGEPYDVFISGDWLSKLKEWVQIQCPNTYSIDF